MNNKAVKLLRKRLKAADVDVREKVYSGLTERQGAKLVDIAAQAQKLQEEPFSAIQVQKLMELKLQWYKVYTETPTKLVQCGRLVYKRMKQAQKGKIFTPMRSATIL